MQTRYSQHTNKILTSCTQNQRISKVVLPFPPLRWNSLGTLKSWNPQSALPHRASQVFPISLGIFAGQGQGGLQDFHSVRKFGLKLLSGKCYPLLNIQLTSRPCSLCPTLGAFARRLNPFVKHILPSPSSQSIANFSNLKHSSFHLFDLWRKCWRKLSETVAPPKWNCHQYFTSQVSDWLVFMMAPRIIHGPYHSRTNKLLACHRLQLLNWTQGSWVYSLFPTYSTLFLSQ